ncbi:ABC transporter substrate-binding protein [Streptomyces clavuligerus]|uniref:Solute binding transport lipoprotein n=1 Tax=Streptomyces clavuligerus TaxID=1901 RepID=B5GZ22_STRCL|nr:ABC transporter substrate-binding protein [Streptomyces clavuligerus]ANW21228.1 peptide-binding protein [Streptomyces clavuligerus]AXU15854.1 peptide-binding protein [Streptomyces clavuligerus]EDY51568.1 lipoprotein oligopeptide binding protein [Streptomyces clavuligerus]EFG05660.1 Solute binding transport lipoprotein [Streptomyces clavuligerus]MBY6305977.1 peptide-binding protein [Streptomyces clavuligerus]
MFHRTCLRASAALASITLLAGCGLLTDEASGGKKRITVGTTSEPTTLDPAEAWDGSWELYRNVFQTLLSLPTGSTSPQPDAAKSCGFVDAGHRVYSCELREGLEFSNGEKLDAAAVKHSIDRIVTIDRRGGPRGLLNSLDRIEVTGERTVRFRLKSADATFPFILATPATSLVPPGEYPADRPRRDGRLTGSGPYVLEAYAAGERAELKRNKNYRGFAERRNDAVTIRYYRDSDSMVKALEDERVDLTYRGLGAQDVVDLQQQGTRDSRLRLVETVGADIRYLVFNAKDPQAGKLAVRRAVAQLVDRGALVSKVYHGTAEPLYSMVPKGIAGHSTVFFDRYGEPDTAKAREILRDAGITAPVELELWFTTDRYGSATRAEFAELKRQLEASGLFRVTVQGRPEQEFKRGYTSARYPVFGRGWFPDFPDPDNFIAPFVGENNVLATPYESTEITDELLPASRRETDRGAVTKDFERAQEIIAKDVRLLPLWQGKLYLAVSEEIGGGERALDPQTVMQLWELYRKASW